jgi:SAM-dependent methyltransferase
VSTTIATITTTLRRTPPQALLRKVTQRVTGVWHQRRFERIEAADGFDQQWGTDTKSPHLDIASLTDRTNGQHATVYWPTHVSEFNKMLDSLLHHPDPTWAVEARERTLVDVGCGKGRTAMVASDRSFRRVIGIDFANDLLRVAEANARRFRGGAWGSPIEFHQADATEWDMPLEPLVIYLYHPFEREVTRPFVLRLAASLRATPRPCSVIYLNPVHEDEFLSTGLFERQYFSGRYADNRYSLLRFTGARP